MKPLLRFRAYCDFDRRKSSPFYLVTLWRDMPQAQKRMRELGMKGWNSAAAGVSSWDHFQVNPRQKLMPDMGEIVLPLSRAGSSVIAHECCHAAYRCAERMLEHGGLKDKYSNEERFCLTVGRLTRQIVKRLCAYEKRRKKS